MSVVTESRSIAPSGAFVLDGVRWSTYDSLLHDADRSRRRLRITFERGVLEIMTLSPEHEWKRRLLAMMIDVLAEELRIAKKSLGSWTLRRETLAQGLEPDDCFYIENERGVRGKDEIDLESDPPPDLAIEVEVSRSAADRMEIYASLRVPEVWRCDPRGSLHIELLRGGRYTRASRSRSFPGLDLPELQRFFDRRGEADETTWIRAFRKWVRESCARQRRGNRRSR